MLLEFLDSRLARPEFVPDDADKEKAIGPFEKMLIFCTAQPQHIHGESATVKTDIVRRYARGGTIAVTPLRDRPHDVVPIFCESWRHKRGGEQAKMEAGGVLTDSAESFLLESVVTHQLSASTVADLVGEARQPVGRPYIENQLHRILRRMPKTTSHSMTKVEELVDVLSEFDFEQLAPQQLERQLDVLLSSTNSLLTRYLDQSVKTLAKRDKRGITYTILFGLLVSREDVEGSSTKINREWNRLLKFISDEVPDDERFRDHESVRELFERVNQKPGKSSS